MKIGLIVEGHGEVEAAPILVRRLIDWMGATDIDVLRPDRRKRGQLVKEAEFKRAIEAMARRVGDDGAIVVIADADADPACQLAPQLLNWAIEARGDRKIAVVLPEREWEAWYIAALASLRGKRGLIADVAFEGDLGSLTNPKGWLSGKMSKGYVETLDQPAFAAEMDIEQARRAYSFEKLVREMARIASIPVPPKA